MSKNPSPTRSEGADRRSTRVAFLRRAGSFLAVGLGVAALPQLASAQSGSCCPSDCRSVLSCSWPTLPYSCSGCGQNCCICVYHDPQDQCFPTTCPCG
jgi:hypothetical protein